MEAAVVAEVLGNTWFGSGLPPASRDRLARVGRLADIPAGTTLIQEGEPCPALGVIVSGRIALRLGIPGVGDRTILTIDDGDVFGWSAVMPAAIATCTGVAVSPSQVILFDGARLDAALAVDPELAATTYRQLLLAVARRLSATRMQLLDLYGTASEPW